MIVVQQVSLRNQSIIPPGDQVLLHRHALSDPFKVVISQKRLESHSYSQSGRADTCFCTVIETSHESLVGANGLEVVPRTDVPGFSK